MKPNKNPVTLQIIYWHGGSIPNEEGEVYAHVHLLVGPDNPTVSDFQKMVAKLRKIFPQVATGEIVRKKIEKLSRVGGLDIGGYALVAWSGYLPKRKYSGWIQYQTARCEYRW